MASVRLCDMPRGGNVGGIFVPNGCGLSRWGFENFMHVCFYGKCPYLARRMGSRPNGKYGVYGNDSGKVSHPCAKPVAAMKWLVERTTLPGATVLDCFAGSGTTGVACLQTGRKFIGVEIEPAYHDIARRRLAEAAAPAAA
jgi:DNA modification methylase